MKLLNQNSLAETTDNVNEALFLGRDINKKDRIEVAEWIAGRQGLPRSYRGLFAPTDQDYANNIRVFTGEKTASVAATGHILGEEACRLLRLLNVDSKVVKDALKKATENFLKAVYENYENDPIASGFYCCGTCTPAFWRHIAAGGLDRQEERLDSGLRSLKRYRDGKGKWRRFPFHWTLLALGDIDLSLARDEIRYATPAMERSLKRGSTDDKYGRRRRVLMERLLSKA